MKSKRKSPGSAAVERACRLQATGYEVTETKREYKVGETGELELTRATEQTKHVPGDWRAVEFWLTNREPTLWSKSPGEREEVKGEAGVIEIARVQETDVPSSGPAGHLPPGRGKVEGQGHLSGPCGATSPKGEALEDGADE